MRDSEPDLFEVAHCDECDELVAGSTFGDALEWAVGHAMATGHQTITHEAV